MATFNGKYSNFKSSSIDELRDCVKAFIDQGNSKKRELKKRTDELTSTLKDVLEEFPVFLASIDSY